MALTGSYSKETLMATITVNTNTLLTLADEVVLVDSTGGPVTVTLPAAHPVGKRYYIKDKFGTTDINQITVLATPNLLDNSASFALTVEKQAVLAHSGGSNWWII